MPCRRAATTLSHYSHPQVVVSDCNGLENIISHSNKPNPICMLQLFCMFSFLKNRPSDSVLLYSAMDMDMQPCSARDSSQSLYCGYCLEDCDGLSKKGRWQKYGDTKEGEKFWVYLCSSCSRLLWRLYSKDEEWHDYHAMCVEYMAFLKEELAKPK